MTKDDRNDWLCGSCGERARFLDGGICPKCGSPMMWAVPASWGTDYIHKRPMDSGLGGARQGTTWARELFDILKAGGFNVKPIGYQALSELNEVFGDRDRYFEYLETLFGKAWLGTQDRQIDTPDFGIFNDKSELIATVEATTISHVNPRYPHLLVEPNDIARHRPNGTVARYPLPAFIAYKVVDSMFYTKQRPHPDMPQRYYGCVDDRIAATQIRPKRIWNDRLKVYETKMRHEVPFEPNENALLLEDNQTMSGLKRELSKLLGLA